MENFIESEQRWSTPQPATAWPQRGYRTPLSADNRAGLDSHEIRQTHLPVIRSAGSRDTIPFRHLRAAQFHPLSLSTDRASGRSHHPSQLVSLLGRRKRLYLGRGREGRSSPPCSLQFRPGAGGGGGGGGLTALAVREAVPPPPPARPRCNRSRQGAAHHHLPDLSGGSHRVPPRTQLSLSPRPAPRKHFLGPSAPRSHGAAPRDRAPAAALRRCLRSGPWVLPFLCTATPRSPRSGSCGPTKWRPLSAGPGEAVPSGRASLSRRGAAAAVPSLGQPGFNGWAMGGRGPGASGASGREPSRFRDRGAAARPFPCRLALGSAALMAARLLQRAPAQRTSASPTAGWSKASATATPSAPACPSTARPVSKARCFEPPGCAQGEMWKRAVSSWQR